MAQLTKFRFESGGASYTLPDIGFEPTTIQVWNYTKWATDGTKVMFYWHKGMTDAYALSEVADDTAINRAIETANGFTVLNTSSFSTGNQTVSGVTAAMPPVVTVGSTSGWTTGDKVRFHDIGGMVQLNENQYQMTVINSTTFSLQDKSGDDIDATAYTAFAAGTVNNIAHNLEIDTTDSGSYRVTLGSAINVTDGDIMYVECRQADQYTNLGDIG